MTATATTTSSSAGSLRAYLITRVLLVIPMVWILVTSSSSSCAWSATRSSHASSGTVPPSVVDASPPRGRPGPAAAVAVRRLHLGHRPVQLRQVDHRQPAGDPSAGRTRRGDARADDLCADRRVPHRHPAGTGRSALPRPAARRRAAHLRGARLRDAGVLPRPAAQAVVRDQARLVAGVRAGQPQRRDGDQQRRAEHAHLPDQRDPVRQQQLHHRRPQARDPAGDHARAC